MNDKEALLGILDKSGFMDHARKTFPDGLPSLEQLRSFNGPDVPPETAWIWGKDDEVLLP